MNTRKLTTRETASPEQVEAFEAWLEDNHELCTEDAIENLYRESIDEMSTVKIGSLEYSGSYVLKQIDDPAYRSWFNDWMDSAEWNEITFKDEICYVQGATEDELWYEFLEDMSLITANETQEG